MHTCVPISPPSWASLPSFLSHPSRSLQSAELISLCYAAASENGSHSFIRLNNITLYVYTTFGLFFHKWNLVCFYLWLLWIMLLGTWAYKYLFESLLSVVLGIDLRVELLDRVVILFIYLFTYLLITYLPVPSLSCCMQVPRCCVRDLRCGMWDL